MSIALQLLINILIPVSLFSLIAAGFSVFFSVSRVQHMAIGASIAASGYGLFALSSRIGFPLAFIGAIVASIVVGLLANALVYERLQKRRWFSEEVMLVASIMILLLSQSVFLFIFGSQPKSISAPEWMYQRLEFATISVTWGEIALVCIAFAALAGFALYLRYSRLGVAMRAVADNREVAEVIGINTRRMRYITIVLVSCLAGLAGALIATEYNLEPYASSLQAVRAYGRTIIGGIGSIPGALLASVLTDGAENIGAFFVSSSYKEIFSFLFVFVFLLVRPWGLFGKKRD